MTTSPETPHQQASVAVPIAAGTLAAFVGFGSTFAVVLAGFAALGASPREAASGLVAVCLIMGLLGIGLSLRWKIPITIAWTTPGSALFVATGAVAGGYRAAVGAYLVAAVLIVIAGVWRPFARAVGMIPLPLASAMLAGVLVELCLAPVRAAAAIPGSVLPVIAAWAVALVFVRRYATVIAVLVAIIIAAATTAIPASAWSAAWPDPVLIAPTFTLHAAIGIGVPLFIVTMASQNLPGLAVIAANGYRAPAAEIFVTTGIGSIATAFLGGHSLNLAAITAALCAGPEAHPDPARRWIASVTAGVAYLFLAVVAGFAAALFVASPPLLIQAVAGLALLGTLGTALATALAREDDRLPAMLTFVTAASGVSILGIGAAFWGLLAGGALMFLVRFQRR